ncbi:MAG: hypothetical protein M3065_07145 [Actinomycetota bacterium]|nr:hypothetical protein [Actinomycetota bacterium]
MDDSKFYDGPRLGRRARREQRALDKRALRSEFELDPPRRFAALRKLVADVGELERARIASHVEAANLRGRPAEPAAKRAHRASR